MTPRSQSRRRNAVRLIAGSLAAGIVGTLCATSAAATPTPITVHRTYGADRYQTAAFLETQGARDVAYVVTGEKFADGVTAGALAGRLGGNIFLAPRGHLTQEVRDVIGYYPKIVVVGSEASVGVDVMTWLQQNTRAQLSRVGGADRYATAAALSASSFSPGVSDVVIATGTGYADALAGSAAAASVRGPVLLVEPAAVPQVVAEELSRLAPKRITVLGGASSVSASVLTSLRQYTQGEVRRIGGVDRFDTSVKVSQAYFPNGASWAELASGYSWADSIGAGAKAGRAGGPLLLSPQDCLTQGVNLEIERLAAQSLEAAGGDGSYSVAASKRTSCGVQVGRYLVDFGTPVGNAEYAASHATMGGAFYPRSVAYTTDPRNSEYRVWDLGSRWTRFTAVTGVQDGITSGLTSRVAVYGDERLLGSYDVSVGRPAVVDVDVRGVDKLKLVTTSTIVTPNTDDQVPQDVFFGDAAVS
ncbi:uncharacterized protein YaiE (UPF0345 family) [Kineococcus radiotolerans]|uniref:Uncharacterized protein YaiE (UPF0345 family) n=1 Tax=Kineococcus radiotolerans TaxID=131568 RepID=A0A7W4TQY9_KINRA|nr:cell wall-binding repeat-containing protein [Kineococcus radiotolerans]MBB2902846.1 uncharacterized protein YaiE (UPF0345 family) [Kineococcus radiotolerans]